MSQVVPLFPESELAIYYNALHLNVQFWYLQTDLAVITGVGLTEAQDRYLVAYRAREDAGVTGWYAGQSVEVAYLSDDPNPA